MACTIDFRRLDEGFGGKTYKRKRQEAENAVLPTAEAQEHASAAMEVDDESLQPTAKRSAIASSENPDRPTVGQPSHDGVIAGKVSGRKWKQPRKQRASAKQVSLKRTTAEERGKEKLIKKAYKERMNELKEEIRKNKIEKRKKAEERKKKKEENILRSGTKFQVISNKNTLKKIAKSKDKKLLKVVPEEFVKNKSKK
ncbi:Coiled-coil domain-containing protein [Melia azedarach]|uniref:Coiled-coil domain-containing protein n=1 Tax=Melia azedarach TaxID=155640 RepID=A0ACC1Z0X3_MELAZ|nr:Coiled-coil domain-containing protein [Melia azedarach]